MDFQPNGSIMFVAAQTRGGEPHRRPFAPGCCQNPPELTAVNFALNSMSAKGLRASVFLSGSPTGETQRFGSTVRRLKRLTIQCLGLQIGKFALTLILLTGIDVWTTLPTGKTGKRPHVP
jgi:hypothetical protein